LISSDWRACQFESKCLNSRIQRQGKTRWSFAGVSCREGTEASAIMAWRRTPNGAGRPPPPVPECRDFWRSRTHFRADDPVVLAICSDASTGRTWGPLMISHATSAARASATPWRSNRCIDQAGAVQRRARGGVALATSYDWPHGRVQRAATDDQCWYGAPCLVLLKSRRHRDVPRQSPRFCLLRRRYRSRAEYASRRPRYSLGSKILTNPSCSLRSGRACRD
jgi:hypothetical protein